MFLPRRRLLTLLLVVSSVCLVAYVNVSGWRQRLKEVDLTEHQRSHYSKGIARYLKKVMVQESAKPRNSSERSVGVHGILGDTVNVSGSNMHTVEQWVKSRSAFIAQNESTENIENTGRVKEVRPLIIRATPPLYLKDAARGNSKARIKSPHDFSLLINEPNRCLSKDGRRDDVFLLVLVVSVPMNTDVRKLVRETWGGQTMISGKQIVTLFLLGKSKDQAEQQLVELESRKHRDILQEDFMDTYRNLTLKSIMGMKWAGMYCAHARYVMKTDDDMFVGYPSLVRYLSKATTPSDRFMAGHVIKGGPIRDPASKWYAPKSIYPFDKYPPFCSGSGYVVSGDMPRLIYETSLFTPFLYLEDVFISICVNQLGVVPVLHRNFNNHLIKYSYCAYQELFTTHMMSSSLADRYSLWEAMHVEPTEPCPSHLKFKIIAY